MSDADESAHDVVDQVRWGSVVENLSAAVGLAAYVFLAGGVAEWARMAGAGLPASHGLAAIEPVTLLASGFQVLVLVPVTLVAFLVAIQVSDDLAASTEKPATVRLLGQGWQIATHFVIVVLALYAALVPTVLIFGLLVAAAGSVVLVVLIAAAAVAAVPAALSAGITRIAGRDPLGGPSVAVTTRMAVVPAVPRAAFERLGGIDRRGRMVASALTAPPVAILAIGASGGRSGNDVMVPSEVHLAAIAILWLELAVVVLTVAGAVLLKTAMARDVVDAARNVEKSNDDQEEPEEDPPTAEERARFSVFVAIALIGALFAFPQSWGVFFVSLMLAGLFSDRLRVGRVVRVVAVSLVFVLGLMAYQAHAPQRFDRLEFSLAKDGDPQPRRFRVALIGSRGDAYIVAACDRTPTMLLDRPAWKSTRPVLLRISKGDVVDAAIVSRKYSFFKPDELSLAGTLLSLVDVGLRPSALISSGSIYGPFGGSVTRDVCGGVDGSATVARAAARALGS